MVASRGAYGLLHKCYVFYLFARKILHATSSKTALRGCFSPLTDTLASVT